MLGRRWNLYLTNSTSAEEPLARPLDVDMANSLKLLKPSEFFNLIRPGEQVVLWTRKEGRDRWKVNWRQTERIDSVVTSIKGDCYHVSSITDIIPETYSKDDVKGSHCLWAEVDPPEDLEYPGEWQAWHLKIMDELLGMTPQPNILLDSGRGWWCFWLMERMANVDELQSGLEMIHAARTDFDPTRCHPAAWSRMPGTINSRTGRRSQAYLVHGEKLPVPDPAVARPVPGRLQDGSGRRHGGYNPEWSYPYRIEARLLRMGLPVQRRDPFLYTSTSYCHGGDSPDKLSIWVGADGKLVGRCWTGGNECIHLTGKLFVLDTGDIMENPHKFYLDRMPLDDVVRSDNELLICDSSTGHWHPVHLSNRDVDNGRSLIWNHLEAYVRNYRNSVPTEAWDSIIDLESKINKKNTLEHLEHLLTRDDLEDIPPGIFNDYARNRILLVSKGGSWSPTINMLNAADTKKLYIRVDKPYPTISREPIFDSLMSVDSELESVKKWLQPYGGPTLGGVGMIIAREGWRMAHHVRGPDIFYAKSSGIGKTIIYDILSGDGPLGQLIHSGFARRQSYPTNRSGGFTAGMDGHVDHIMFMVDEVHHDSVSITPSDVNQMSDEVATVHRKGQDDISMRSKGPARMIGNGPPYFTDRASKGQPERLENNHFNLEYTNVSIPKLLGNDADHIVASLKCRDYVATLLLHCFRIASNFDGGRWDDYARLFPGIKEAQLRGNNDFWHTPDIELFKTRFEFTGDMDHRAYKKTMEAAIKELMPENTPKLRSLLAQMCSGKCDVADLWNREHSRCLLFRIPSGIICAIDNGYRRRTPRLSRHPARTG